MYTRREFGQLTLGGVALPLLGGLSDSKVAGVRLGVQTYSFRDLPRADGADHIDVIINAMKECGLSECELWAPQVEPRVGRGNRDQLRAWRLDTPIGHFRDVKKKFDAAGITVYAYNYSFSADMTDAEIDRGFEM